MKVAARVNKKFAMEVKAELVVLGIIINDGVDRIYEFNEIDKYRRIVLS